MKRKSNLYCDTYDMNNILSAFNEVCLNTKNKRKIAVRIFRPVPDRAGPYGGQSLLWAVCEGAGADSRF